MLRNPLDQGASHKKQGKSFCKRAGLRKALKLKSATQRVRSNQRMRSKKAEPADKKQFLGNSRLGILGDFSLRNSGIRYYVILGLDPRISVGNFRILCDEIHGSSRGMTQGLGILKFLVNSLRNSILGNSRIYFRNSSLRILDWEF